MADEIKLLLTVDTKNSLGSLSGLEEKLNVLKERIKDVEIGSSGFKALQQEIVKSETQLKNLNKSIEGLDTEALAGEFGKFAGGITAGFTAIAAVGGKSMEEVVQVVGKGMALMQGIKGATEAWTSSTKVLKGVLDNLGTGIIGLALAALAATIWIITKAVSAWQEKNDELVVSNIALIRTLSKLRGELKDYLAQLGQEADTRSQREKDYSKVFLLELQARAKVAQIYKAEMDRIENSRYLQYGEKEKLLAQANKKFTDATIQIENDKNTALANINSKYSKTKTENTKAEQKTEIENWDSFYQKEAEIKKGWNELELQRAGEDAVRKNEIQNKQFDEQLALLDTYRNSTGKLSEEDELLYQQTLQKKLDANAAYQKQLSDQELQAWKDNQQAIQDAKDEQASIDEQYYQMHLEEVQGKTDEEYTLQKDNLNKQIEDINQFRNSTGQLSKEDQLKYDKLIHDKAKLDKWYTTQKRKDSEYQLDIMASLAGEAAQLFGEQTAAYKVLASAQVIMSSASAIMKAWDTYATMPVIAIAETAVIAAVGIAQLAKINNVQFADGGVINGPSHAQGGILTPFGEVEGGEGIINNRSMSNASLRNMASAANVAGGGRSFGVGDGSVQLSQASISAIAQAINDKKVFITESDITTTQNRVKMYEQNSTY